MSIKFLSAKFGLTPPRPKRAKNEEKVHKLQEDSQNWHSFRGGNAILWTKWFYGHLGVSDQVFFKENLRLFSDLFSRVLFSFVPPIPSRNLREKGSGFKSV